MALAILPLKELKKNERETDKDEFDYLQEKQDVDGRTTKQSKEHDDIEWDGMEECEDILEKDNSLQKNDSSSESLTNEKVFEELHKTNEGKDSLGDRNLKKGEIEEKEQRKVPEMEEYVKQREDQLLAMSGGNTLHYQVEAMENMTGQNYMNDSVQVVTEDIHNEREFSMTDDVVEDAFDMSENVESIDDILLDEEKNDDIVYIYADEDKDSDRMAFPDMEDEAVFSGDMEHKNPWSN